MSARGKRGGGAAAGAGRAADAAGAAGALARCAHAARCFVCPTCDKQVCSAHMDGIKVGGGERQHAPPAPLSAPSLASPPAAAATIFIRRSPPPALSRLQPNFDLGVEQAVVRIWMKSPWAAAKECSFCRLRAQHVLLAPELQQARLPGRQGRDVLLRDLLEALLPLVPPAHHRQGRPARLRHRQQVRQEQEVRGGCGGARECIRECSGMALRVALKVSDKC